MHVARAARLVVVVGTLMLAFPAHAQERPWAANVSEQSQTTALELYREGNALFVRSQYAQALAKYKQAIRHWDHPAIRFNMALCYINLEQPLEAHDSITRSLAYGRDALDEGKYDEALNYQKLLRGQLAELKVVCSQEGAEVRLDGERLFVGPGEATRVLLPGRHEVVATKRAFLTVTRPLDLLPGKQTVEAVELIPLDTQATTTRRWKAWKPWAVVGIGAGVALLGVPLQLHARSTLDAYDANVAMLCPQGCSVSELGSEVRDDKARAVLENRLAVGAFVAGGVAVATGLVLVLLNTPYRTESEHPAVVLTPSVGGGVSLTLSFSY